MHLDRSALEAAIELSARIKGADRFAELTRLAAPGASVLSLDEAASVTLASLLPELSASQALGLADLPLTGVTIQPVGDVENRLEPADVALHPLSEFIRESLGATVARRLRYGAAREDLLPHEIVPLVLDIQQGAPGQAWAHLTFTLATSKALGQANFGTPTSNPVIRRTDIAVGSIAQIGGAAYALTLARVEPEPEPLPPQPETAAPASRGTFH